MIKIEIIHGDNITTTKYVTDRINAFRYMYLFQRVYPNAIISFEVPKNEIEVFNTKEYEAYILRNNE